MSEWAGDNEASKATLLCIQCGEPRPPVASGTGRYCRTCHNARRRERYQSDENYRQMRLSRNPEVEERRCQRRRILRLTSPEFRERERAYRSRLDPERLAERRAQPEAKRKANVRSNRGHKRRNDASRERAHRIWQEWTGPELEVVARADLTAREVAKMLGRTLSAVYAARKKLRNEPREIHLAGVAQAVKQ